MHITARSSARASGRSVRRSVHLGAVLALATGISLAGGGNALAASPAAGSTAPSPAADHAGSGLERLGLHRLAVAASTPAGLQGLDVSEYQGNVDWSTVYADGGRWSYVKATEGASYTNPYFSQQYSGSYNAEMVRGAYHFANPSESAGSTQADYFVNNGGGWSADTQTLPGALDIEYNPSGSECYGYSQSGMVNWIASFLNEYHYRTGRWAAVYSTTDWWTTCTGNYGGFAANDPLWIANYNGTATPMPNGWGTYTMWQWADSGVFPGDQDVFNGDVNRAATLANNSPTGTYDSGIAGKCIDDHRSVKTNDNPVDLYSCNSTLAQEWNPSNGTIRDFGMCLDVAGGGTANGTKVQLYGCNGTGSQQWKAGANNSLVNPQSGRCLDDPDSTTTDGTQLQIWGCNGTNAQSWTLRTS